MMKLDQLEDLTWAKHKTQSLQPTTQVQLNNHSSEHNPTITIITPPNSKTCTPEKHLSIQLNNLDNTQFLQSLQQYLPQDTTTKDSIETTTQDLLTTIKLAYNDKGRWVTTNPARSKSWWNKEQLKDLVKLRNQVRRKMLKHQTDKSKEEYYHYQKFFKQKFWEFKSSHWRKLLAEKGLETTENLSYIPCQKQPNLPPDFPLITEDEVINAISSLPNRKAQGPDSIPNKLMKLSKLLLTTILTDLFYLCLRKGQYLRKWKEAQTAIIRKAAKDNYTNSNAYRQIALLNTLGKLFKKIINSHLLYWKHLTNSTHPGQIGGRPDKSINDACATLTL
ncbi:hypothetical protein O181_023352 [Austropuccinia psidii MF-1]|uniref:Reverse transcriptase domain-containing protein n=1 Tax=Austropuccinia psidii MF-1 TaxID=1389203 RepID=A0A9Q3CH83_9BASI|nr:hypothetical protein [Austropuccinia psidii MF-1]